jgi:hypothetical protein
MPPENPAGFAPADWLLVVLLLVLLCAGLFGRRSVDALAAKKHLCFVALFLLPVILRLLLLSNHPVPVPDIYDEFSHLLQADTLLHGRLANPPHPMHRFFETFFVLQQPSYSSIYPLGMGLVLAFGRVVSGVPWTGVLIMSGAFCACCYWMLRGWVAPVWALLGGLIAVMQFGPLCQWTNSYWGGFLAATGGCLVFGALPRLRESVRWRDAVLLGAGFGMHMLARQVESVLLLVAVVLFLAPVLVRGVWRVSGIALATVLPVIVLILLQNHAVTHSWTTLPEKLSQEQYGVPAALTFQQNPVPQLALTPQQEMDYKAQAAMHGTRRESWQAFFLRLEYRVRYYRFFFLPPLYLAAIAFLFTLRERRMQWVAATLALFALGTNLFPYLLVHYLAGVTCLFVLVSVSGLRLLSGVRIRGVDAGSEMAGVLVALCVAEFVGWYGLHLFETPGMYAVLRYETWDAVGHDNARRRVAVANELRGFSGPLLVFVRYSPRHVFQEEWVWNAADIDASRIVYARDLGPEEDQQLIRYYPARKVLLLEPDNSVPRLSEYSVSERRP